MRNNKRSIVESTANLIKEPIAIEFNEFANKVRNNLLIVSVLSIIICTNNIQISNDSSILGLKFIGLNIELIQKIFFWMIAYFMIHFILLSIDTYSSWKMKLTYHVLHGQYEKKVFKNNDDDRPYVSVLWNALLEMDYNSFILRQKIRWFLIETILPILIGVYACKVLFKYAL
jgi:hypothetical protein